MMLELRGVWFQYPGAGSHALRGVSLELGPGSFKLVTGPNGAGKTTLLLVAAGLLKPCRGEVLLGGRPLHEQLPGARRHIGLLFQNPEAMLFNPTVEEEISYVPRQIAPADRAAEMVGRAVDRLGLPRGLLSRPPHMLSYGEKKLVALASILSYEPDILLLDEPFTNLHPMYVGRLTAILEEHVGKGGSVLVASHDAHRYLSLASDIIVMEEGRVADVRRAS